MQTIVDSNEKLLNGPEIIATAATELMPDTDPSVLLYTIAAETTLPSADLVQIGNTVFLAHRGKGEHKNKLVGRAFNLDTGRNFVDNVIKYTTYIKEKRYTHYTTTFNNPSYVNAFRILDRHADKLGIQVMVNKHRGNAYVAYIKLNQ